MSRLTPAALTQGFSELGACAARTLAADGVPEAQRRFDRSLDMKYVGQGYTLNIAVPAGDINATTLTLMCERFHVRHEDLYGFRADSEAVEMINMRLQATGVLAKSTPPRQPCGPRQADTAQCGERPACLDARQGMVRYQIYDRARLLAGHVLPGPAIVEQVDSTTLIPPAWIGMVDGYGNLIVGREEWHGYA